MIHKMDSLCNCVVEKIDTIEYGCLGLPIIHHDAMIPNDVLGGPLFGGGFILGVVLFMVIVAVALLITRYSLKISNRFLFWAFVPIWLFGFLVYDIGMYTGDPISLLSNAPMAVLHAFEIFLLDGEVDPIHEEFHNSTLFMFFFSLAHILAAIFSTLFVIELFGFSIRSAVRNIIVSFKHTDIAYVFWGMNDATYSLAKSIQKYHSEKEDASYRIIIVRAKNDEETSFKNNMERLFDFLSLKNKDLEKLQELKCLTAVTYYDIAQFYDKDSTQILKDMRLNRIRKIIKKAVKELHFFFLSDDASYNLQCVTMLKRDKTISDTFKRKVVFHCHMRYNSVTRVVEDIESVNNVEVHIIDSSHISVECLKQKVEYQPVSFVDIDTKFNLGTVQSDFTSLIVGFGTTGRDALRFLYEFGAFVDSRSNGKVWRSPFHCHVVDRNMNELDGAFINISPMVFKNVNHEDSEPLVQLHNMDYNSDEFYNKLLRELSDKLNYIVIAVGSDEEGIALAVRILKYMRREVQKIENLRIFVRSYKPEMVSYMEKVKKLYDDKVERIILFGKLEDIFSYNMIVNDEIDRRAEIYCNMYCSLTSEYGNEGPDDENPDDEGPYKRRRKDLRQNPTFENLQKLRRQETEDKCNAMHENTKIKILRSVMPDGVNEFIPALFSSFGKVNRDSLSVKGPGNIIYPKLSEKQQLLMDNLAKLEHLRWNASHEILGYTTLPDEVKERRCNEVLFVHNCLRPWEELDKESSEKTEENKKIAEKEGETKYDYENYKKYDYAVVETTIYLAKETNT